MHDLGIFRAVGMTPRQTIVMVICWVAGTGLAAGLVAVPAGMAVHRYVLPVMASLGRRRHARESASNVYHPAEIAALALAGLAIAVIGALLPGQLGGRDQDRDGAARRVARPRPPHQEGLPRPALPPGSGRLELT